MIPRELLTNEIVLERMKVASRMMVSGHTLASMEVRTWQEPTLDALIVGLQTEVLAERIGDDEVKVPVSHEVTYDYAPRGLWAIPFAVSMLAVGGMALADRWAALAFAVVLAACWVILDLGGGLSQCRREEWHGEVEVSRTAWRRFPEATIVYPRELGRPIRYVTEPTSSAYWEEP